MHLRRSKKSFTLLSAMACLAILAAACAGLPQSGEDQPTQASPLPTEQPVETTQPAGPATQDALPTGQPTPLADETGSTRPIPVQAVSVEIGEGSPIPVNVLVSGEWPDLCAQLASVEQQVEGVHIEISLLASPADPNCPPDRLGLPFSMAIPLNMVEMPAGTISVSVNGVETSFEWTVAGGALAPGAEGTGELLPITVEDVQVQVGVGSPIPVDVVVSGTWPSLCAQVARLEQHISGSTFEISLQAHTGRSDCPLDAVGIPFRIAIPLNMAEMELGASYTVRVNGVETTFEWNAQPTVTPEGAATLAYLGPDGNLWVLEGPGQEPRQVTQDAAQNQSGGEGQAETVQYYFPALSSDGRMLAYRRDVGTPVESGLQFQFGLWVTDLSSGESRQVLDKIPAGLAWKPETHLLAYGLAVAEGYFPARGQVDAALASGIWAVDLDQAELEPSELIKPERGYTLAVPVWSPDGRFLSFDEVHLYEGRGMFAYYDFESQKYVPWEKAIGLYDWSPDGSQIVYDYMTYAANGEERIYLRERLGQGEERQISPEPVQGYAFWPRFSPQGDRVAYLTSMVNLPDADPAKNTYKLFVLDLAGGEPRELGEFEGVLGLDWAPDGKSLVFSAGPYDSQQLFMVNVETGTVTTLGDGSNPVLATP